MRQISTEIEIDASAARVWAVLTDLPAYSEWNPVIREAGGSLVPGARLHLFIAPPGLAQRRAAVELLVFEPEREFRWLGRLLAPHVLDGDHSFKIDALGPKRVRLLQQELFSGLLVPFVAPWLVPRMTRGFEAMNAALKQRAEGLPSGAVGIPYS